MSEAAYRKHLKQGPDAMSEAETLAALDWRDANPAEAHRVQARLETERREALDRETLREDWLREGGDPTDFEAAHKAVSAKAKEDRLAAMDREAREAHARAIVGGF